MVKSEARMSTPSTAPTSCHEGKTLGVPGSWARRVMTADQPCVGRQAVIGENSQMTHDSVKATSRNRIP